MALSSPLYVIVVLVMLTGVSANNPYMRIFGSADCVVTEFQRGAVCVDAGSKMRTDKYDPIDCRNCTRLSACVYLCLDVKVQITILLECGCIGWRWDPVTCPTTPNTLPERCLSFGSAGCEWYHDCLEAKFNCQGSPDDYGIAYAEKYCKLYESKYKDFSSLGQRWIEAVRKCLQVELLPYLHPLVCASCRDIKVKAFNSHARCYLTPYTDAPSICDLPLQDFWRIFWTIKGAFVSEFVETSLEMLKVMKGCTEAAALNLADFVKKLFIELNLPNTLGYTNLSRSKRSPVDEKSTLFLGYQIHREKRLSDIEQEDPNVEYHTAQKGQTSSPRIKRSTSDNDWQAGEGNEALHYHQTAAEVAKELATQLGWSSLKIQWFTYGVYDKDANMLKVNVFLADQTLNASSPSAVNLTRVVQQAAESYQDGKIRFNVRGTALPAGKMLGCIDEECKETFVNATDPNTSSASDAVVLGGPWLVMIVSAAAAALLVIRAPFLK